MVLYTPLAVVLHHYVEPKMDLSVSDIKQWSVVCHQ